VDIAELYEGHREAEVTPSSWRLFSATVRCLRAGGHFTKEYVMLRAGACRARQSALGRSMSSPLSGAVAPVTRKRIPFSPPTGTYYALDALLNDQIKVVTVIGKAGTGKTLLAIAAALHKTFDKKTTPLLVCGRHFRWAVISFLRERLRKS
jgi:PhoH-like ATPase